MKKLVYILTLSALISGSIKAIGEQENPTQALSTLVNKEYPDGTYSSIAQIAIALWVMGADDTQLSPQDQQKLATLCNKALREDTQYEISRQKGHTFFSRLFLGGAVALSIASCIPGSTVALPAVTCAQLCGLTGLLACGQQWYENYLKAQLEKLEEKLR